MAYQLRFSFTAEIDKTHAHGT